MRSEKSWPVCSPSPEALELGEHFLQAVAENTHIDDGWAANQCAQVGTRLNAAHTPALAFKCVSIWSDILPAFTVPGRYIYLSRMYQQMLWTDDAVAFVVAHEMAHHFLGHLHLNPVTAMMLRRLPSVAIVPMVLQRLAQQTVSVSAEYAADKLALDICVHAGYQQDRCLQAMTALKKLALDAGAVSNVLDDEEESDLIRFWRELKSGHPNLTRRIERLRQNTQSCPLAS